MRKEGGGKKRKKLGDEKGGQDALRYREMSWEK